MINTRASSAPRRASTLRNGLLESLEELVDLVGLDARALLQRVCEALHRRTQHARQRPQQHRWATAPARCACRSATRPRFLCRAAARAIQPPPRSCPRRRRRSTRRASRYQGRSASGAPPRRPTRACRANAARASRLRWPRSPALPQRRCGRCRGAFRRALVEIAALASASFQHRTASSLEILASASPSSHAGCHLAPDFASASETSAGSDDTPPPMAAARLPQSSWRLPILHWSGGSSRDPHCN